MVKKQSFLSRLFQPKQLAEPEVKKVIIQTDPVGSSGTLLFSGFFDEEYLPELTGYKAADAYDKMRRNDSVVSMGRKAVRNPILSASWEVVAPPSATDDEKRHTDFISHILFDDLGRSTWREFLGEALTVGDFGHSVFEVVHKAELNHPEFGSYTGIAQLGWRSPKTFYEWKVDPKTGELISLEQFVNGDLMRRVKMDAKFLVVMTMEKEGDNYEGISLLRPCYGPWFRKQTYLKLMAIGIEKNAVPTPKCKVPDNKFRSEDHTQMVNVLKKYVSHQSNYITYPASFDVDFNSNNYDPTKTKDAITFENQEIIYSFLANFLLLGSGGGGGSFSLSQDLSDFFLSGLLQLAEIPTEKINRKLIPDLIKLNFGPQGRYPKLKASGISDKAGKELGELIKILVDGRCLIPDETLELHLRKRIGLPPPDEEGKRFAPPPVVPGIPPGGSQNPEDPKEPEEEPVDDTEDPDDEPDPDEPDPKLKKAAKQRKEMRDYRMGRALAEKYKPAKLITAASEDFRELMEQAVKEIADDLISRIMKSWAKASDTGKLSAHKGIKARGASTYRSGLLSEMATVAAQSLEQARKEVPKASKVKLAEFERLPKKVQKKLKAQSDLLVDTQLADLEKAVYFQFTSSVDASMGSEALLEKDLEQAAEKYIKSPGLYTAAGNTASFVVNESRNAFFFDKEVLEEIHSFTFTNDDPVSPICEDLAGTVFSADDPEAERYYPPLHYNCKSYLVPNLKGAKDNPEIDPTGLKPSDPELEKYINLSEKR